MGFTYLIFAGSMMFSASILPILDFSESNVFGLAQYDAICTGTESIPGMSMRCLATLMRPRGQSRMDWNSGSMLINDSRGP